MSITINNFPAEMFLVEIASYLKEDNLAIIGEANKIFRNNFHSNFVWKKFVIEKKNIPIEVLKKYFGPKEESNFENKITVTNFYRAYCHYFQKIFNNSPDEKTLYKKTVNVVKKSINSLINCFTSYFNYNFNVFNKKLEIDKQIKEAFNKFKNENEQTDQDAKNEIFKIFLENAENFSIPDLLILLEGIGIPNCYKINIKSVIQGKISIDVLKFLIEKGENLDFKMPCDSSNCCSSKYNCCKKKLSQELINQKNLSINTLKFIFKYLGIPNYRTLNKIIARQENLTIDFLKFIFEYLGVKNYYSSELDFMIINKLDYYILDNVLRNSKNLSIDVVKFFIKKGVKVYKHTLNYYLKYQENISIDMIKLLIENGAKVNNDPLGTLFTALRHQKNISIDMIKLLIENGVTVDESTLNDYLRYQENISIDILKLLIEKGAQVYLNTLLLLLRKKNTSTNMFKLLIEKVDSDTNKAFLNYVLEHHKNDPKIDGVIDLLKKKLKIND
jgi:hypothetical protein